jgi:DNA polymerase-3 subunit delta
MLTIFCGDDQNNLAYEVHKITQYHANTPIKHLYFDDNYQHILDAVCQIDLFEEEQIFIIHDATFLLNSKPNDLHLTEMLSKLNQELYFVIETKKRIFNKYAKDANIKVVSKFTAASKHALINLLLKQAEVRFENNSAQELFEGDLTNDPFMVEIELNKLVLSANNRVITQVLVERLINETAELNIFNLVRHLLNDDKESLIKLYDNLITLKYQPIELIQIMASQLFNLKILKLANANRYSQYDIEDKLRITKFMQFANRDILNKITIDRLNQTIKALTLLDYNIKHSLVNPYLGLKLMLSLGK